MDENLQPRGVPGQLAQSHDADDAEKLQHIVFLLQLGEQEVEVKRERGHDVDDVDGRLEEVELVGGDDEADDDLEGEPGVAGALDVEERVVRLRALLLESPGDVAVGGAGRRVAQHRHAHLGVRLETERQDGDHDEEHRYHRRDLEVKKYIKRLVQD